MKKFLPSSKMADENSRILTIIVIVIIILIVLWLFWRLNGSNSVCIAATPDPVGNVRSKSHSAGELTISWDPTPNATHYRVYLNPCGENCDSPIAQSSSRKVRGGHGGCESGGCCPTQCDACVSQFNYKKLIETCDTSVCIDTCEPCVCFLVVAYNRCGQAGRCSEVNYAQVECVPGCVEGCIVSNDCDGLVIRWDCPPCCEVVHVYLDGQLVESVECCEGDEVCLPQAEECVEVALQCESACGLGELNVIDYCDKHKRRNKHRHDDDCECDECSHRHNSHAARRVAARRTPVAAGAAGKKAVPKKVQARPGLTKNKVQNRVRRSAKSFSSSAKKVSLDNGPREVNLR